MGISFGRDPLRRIKRRLRRFMTEAEVNSLDIRHVRELDFRGGDLDGIVPQVLEEGDLRFVPMCMIYMVSVDDVEKLRWCKGIRDAGAGLLFAANHRRLGGELVVYVSTKDYKWALARLEEKKRLSRPRAINPTVSQLRGSDIPDSCVLAVWITFKSPGDCHYTVVYTFDHPSGPYILLSQDEKDWIDFGRVWSVINDGVGGRRDDGGERTDDIYCVIRLPYKPTQDLIAHQVESVYGRLFRDAEISVVHYSGVAEEVARASKLPLQFEER